MKAFPAALAIAAGLAIAAPAAAGGYVAAGIGSDATLTGDLDRHFDADGRDSGRLVLGTRAGAFALEASAFGTQLAGSSSLMRGAMETGPAEFSALSLGVDVKYHLGLVLGLEGYGRAGLSKTWLTDAPGSRSRLDYAGRGYALGGGLQYALRALPGPQAAIWLDYTRHTTRLQSPDMQTLEGDSHMVMLGLSVGTGL